ncbi:MAG: hypothetical protein K9N23_20255 [Akkermansiaceae bacterium]|nr:hypothetical protein [Akkermansiaceae bacterium]
MTAEAPARPPSIVRRLALSALRIVGALAVVLAVAGCLVMQPTGSGPPAVRQADANLLREQVRAFTEDFGPRYQDRPENLARCRGFLIREFRRCGAETEEQVYSSCIPRSLSSVHLSDHRNYWPFGYPAIMVTDTAFYRNENYHQAGDVWQSLDYPRMALAVTQVYQAVLALGR